MTSLSIRFSRGQQFKLVLFGALAIGVLATVAGRGTLAYFTTQVSSTANAFTAGNLHFTIANFAGAPTTVSDVASGTVSSSITLTDIKPGDTVYAPLRITNAGSLDSQWGVSYTTSGTAFDLANGLQMGIVGSNGSNGGTGATTDCTAAGFLVGSGKFPERILDVAAMVPSGPTTVVSYLTSAPVTTQAGQFSYVHGSTSLPLIHGTTDVLCVEVSFPETGASVPENAHERSAPIVADDNMWNGPTNSTYSTTVVFTFDAKQHDYPVVMDERTAAVTGNH